MIRGNLIVVPIENSFLYVEPVYLIAEGTEIPQLKRVIATHGEQVVMQPTLEAALQDLFGQTLAGAQPAQAQPAGAQRAAPVAGQAANPAELNRARQALERAQEALQDGDLVAFGQAFERLRNVLNGAQGRQQQQEAPDTTAAADADTPGRSASLQE